ncbi:MAG: helix-turn-helix domain-containing protein, partial [Desulfosarcina sp.]
FLTRISEQNASCMRRISEAAMEQLLQQSWPGNVRQLENAIARAVLIGSGETLLPVHLMLDDAAADSGQRAFAGVGTTVREMEKELIYNTLSAVNDNRTHAAKMLGISIRTLRNKLSEYRTACITSAL